MRKAVAWMGVGVFVVGMALAGVAGCAYNFIPGAVAGGIIAMGGFVAIGYGCCTTKPAPN